jgi:hypothetical protein
MSSSRCSEGGFGLWLGDKGIINGKTSTILHILTGYGPTPHSFSLNAGRKHNRWDIELAEELSLGLLAGASSKDTVARVTRRSSCRNPNLKSGTL